MKNIKIKELLDSLRHMSPYAYGYLKACIIIACLPLLAALYIVFCLQYTGEATYALCKLLEDLISAPAAILLIAVILAVILEDQARK